MPPPFLYAAVLVPKQYRPQSHVPHGPRRLFILSFRCVAVKNSVSLCLEMIEPNDCECTLPQMMSIPAYGRTSPFAET